MPESPMTQFVYSMIQEIFSSGKSAILEFPTNFGNLSLIIANEFVYSNKKSAIVFTNPETIDGLNDDYYLVMEEKIPLRWRVPIGIKTESGVKIRVHFPKGAKRSRKGSFAEEYKKELISSDRPIIILASDGKYIDFDKEGLLLGDFKKPNLAIFNNTLFLSDNKLLKIVDWCRKNDLQYLILTNHLSPNYYRKLGKESVILPFHNGLLRELATIDGSIDSIFAKPDYRKNSKLLSKFSIDQPFHYSSVLSIEYAEIENGSVLVQCAKDMFQVLNSMNIRSMVLKHEILQLVKIGYESINSFVPIHAQSMYSEDVGARINGKELCEVIVRLSEDDRILSDKTGRLVSTFMTIWNCLDKCFSPFYERGYTKDNKFSRLVSEIRANIDNYRKIYVLPTNRKELNLLNKLLRSLFPDDFDKIVIMSIVNIDENQIENAMAILPGNPKLNELYVLNYPFEKIKVLAYHGDNIEFVKELISLYNHIDSYRSIIFSESISNIVKEVPGVQKHLSKVPSI